MVQVDYKEEDQTHLQIKRRHIYPKYFWLREKLIHQEVEKEKICYGQTQEENSNDKLN